jgi:hypothetical protein
MESVENWKSIPGLPGYLISDHGRPRCLNGRTRLPDGFMSPMIDTYGRPFLTIQVREPNGETRKRCPRICRLVMLAFVGPCPPGMEVCHYDGNPTNNRLDNLRYDTHQANMEDAVRHGRWRSNYGPKLTPEMIEEIQSLASHGMSKRQMAIRFGINPATVAKAIAKQRTQVS